MFLTNKYTKWYFQIIYRANGVFRSRGDSEYFEEHHIIPKKLGGSNSKQNLVLLTAREHFIVHWLLTKCFEGVSKSKMVCAFWMLANTRSGQRNYSSRYYEIARKKFSEQQTLVLPEDKIIDMYVNGSSTYEIAEKLNCSQGTIIKILKNNNFKIRTYSEARLGFNINDFKDEIIDLYNQGMTLQKIAEKFNCSNVTIGNFLLSNDIDLRTGSETRLGFNINEFKDEIIDLYKQGISTYKIAEKFKCNYDTINKFLRKNNIKIRTTGEARTGIIKGSKLDDFKDEIIDLYINNKLNTYQIAERFKCNNVTVWKFLKTNNVKMRRRGRINR